jgi:TIR domain
MASAAILRPAKIHLSTEFVRGIMAYEWDIFISYENDAQMGPWVVDHLAPFVRSFVGNAANRPISVFVDRTRIQAGDSWPNVLRRALATSRCMVAVWSPLYFFSEWCRREAAVIIHREEKYGFRTLHQPRGLLVPVSVFDGDFFPARAKQIQWRDLQNYWIAGAGFSVTSRFVDFQDAIRSMSHDVASSLAAAPPWTDAWLTDEWLNVPSIDFEPVQRSFDFPDLDQ